MRLVSSNEIPDNSAQAASPVIVEGDKQQKELLNLLLDAVVFDYQTECKSDIAKAVGVFVANMASDDAVPTGNLGACLRLSLVNPSEAGCDLNLIVEGYLRQYVVQYTDKLQTHFKVGQCDE